MGHIVTGCPREKQVQEFEDSKQENNAHTAVTGLRRIH